MTNEETINKTYYRRIIEEMIEHKDNKHYAFMVFCYAVGLEKARLAQSLGEFSFDYEIRKNYDFDEVLNNISKKLNTVDGDFREITVYELESTKNKEKAKSFVKRLFNKNK